MSAIDAAKEVVRIANTAGLSKDVIDLMEIKLALLTEEVALLTKKNAILVSKNLELETELKQFRSQNQHAVQILKLDVDAAKALKHFFDQDGRVVAVENIMGILNCPKGQAQYHCDKLAERKFIAWGMIPFSQRFNRDIDTGYEIAPAGRKFVMENLSA